MAGKKRTGESPRPFRDNEEFLVELIEVLKQKAFSYVGEFDEHDFSSIGDYRLPGKASQKWKRFMSRLRATRQAAKSSIPLVRLARTHDLGLMELLVPGVMVCMYADPEFERQVRQMARGESVTIQAMQYLLASTVGEYREMMGYFSEQHPLLSSGLISVDTSRPGSSEFHHRQVRMEFKTVETILGYREAESVGSIVKRSLEVPDMRLESLFISADVREQLRLYIENPECVEKALKEWECTHIPAMGHSNIACIWGNPGSGRDTLAATVAGELGLPLERILVPRKCGFHEAQELVKKLQAAASRDLVIVLHPGDALLDPRFGDGDSRSLFSVLENLSNRLILITLNPPERISRIKYYCRHVIHAEPPGREVRCRLWKELLPPGIPLDEAVTPEVLANKMEFGASAIIHAISQAVQKASGRTGTERKIILTDFTSEVVQEEGQDEPQLSSNTIPSETCQPSVTLKHVVLPPGLERKVRMIVSAIGMQDQVLKDWGFGHEYRVGQGISVLLRGPSGTGKTLTVEAIAGELDRPLRILTAANLVSKWLGETDQNVTKLFRTMAGSREIFLIDEADSLLGARSSATHESDHYYNRHVNTFLTELDSFPGVVFFSTNMAENIDRAFDRRIRWKLTFPEPNVAARTLIWRKAMPEAAPLDPDIDLELLAMRYPISGGLIRNAVLQAAYAAATAGRAISMKDLSEAAEAESENRIVAKSSIGFGPQYHNITAEVEV